MDALYLYADDLIVFTSDKCLIKLQQRLQGAVNSLSSWYKMNRLKTNPKKSKLLVIATNSQLKKVNQSNFNISYSGVNIPLVKEATYLGLEFKNNLSWDKHIKTLCKSLNYKNFQLKQLRKAGAPQDLLLSVYKTFIQCKFDYGISIWGMTTQYNINKIQRKQNRAARIILGVTDFRNTCGITLVKRLGLQTIRERRNYFLTKFTFESIMGIAPDYLSTRIEMNVDRHGYNTRSSNNSDVYPPKVNKEIFRRSLVYSGAILWNQLPLAIKESTDTENFKRNYRKLFAPQN